MTFSLYLSFDLDDQMNFIQDGGKLLLIVFYRNKDVALTYHRHIVARYGMKMIML